MSAFQFVVIFTVLALALGFSPSNGKFGPQVAVSKTRVFEVNLANASTLQFLLITLSSADRMA